MRLTARRVPLRGRLPLQVLIEQHVGHQLPPRAVDVGGLAALERGGPLGPWAFAVARVNRSKQRVVLDPPRLFADECLQVARAPGIVAPLRRAEPIERRPQRRVLEAADAGVVDLRRPPQRVEAARDRQPSGILRRPSAANSGTSGTRM